MSERVQACLDEIQQLEKDIESCDKDMAKHQKDIQVAEKLFNHARDTRTQLKEQLRELKGDMARAERRERLHAKAKELRKEMQCRCDLDNWEPEYETGHSWVCPIHKRLMEMELEAYKTKEAQ